MASVSQTAQPEVTVIHSLDLPPTRVVGGVETWIRDFVAWSPSNTRVLGVLNKRSADDRHDRLDDAHAIATIDREKKFPPHLFKLTLGLLRNRHLISGDIQVHRLELAIICRILLPLRKIVLLIHTNNQAQRSFHEDFRWKLYGPIFFLIERLALRAANSALVYSGTDGPRLAGNYKNVTIGRAWCSDEFFEAGEAKPPSERSAFLWVGRFELVKDPLLALDSFAESSVNHDKNLCFVGSGSLKRQLERRISALGMTDRVILLPPCNAQELMNLLSGAVALIHTSHFEGAPRILVEAAAAGCPLITCEDSDPEGIALESGSGILVGSRSKEAFSASLTRLAKSARRARPSVRQDRRASVAVPQIFALLHGDSSGGRTLRPRGR